jgi:peptidylprolyl isomerase
MRLAALAAAFALCAAPALAQDFHPVDPDNLLVLDTSKGRVIVEMRPDIAPGHVARIKALARKGYYDNDVFYRVVPGFMVQTGEKTVGGDPASGMGTLKAEFSFKPTAPIAPVVLGAGFAGDMAAAADPDGRAWPKFCEGVASTAHYNDPDSGDGQIFLMIGAQNYLDRTFTAWGRVVAGEDLLKTFAPGEPPASPDKLIKARIASDMPESERPKVSVADPSSAAFKAAVAKAKKEKGDYLSVCDITPPVEVK